VMWRFPSKIITFVHLRIFCLVCGSGYFYCGTPTSFLLPLYNCNGWLPPQSDARTCSGSAPPPLYFDSSFELRFVDT